MTKTPPVAERFSRLRLAAITLVSLALSFTVFFFTPMDLYLNNPTDFVVDWRYLTPPWLGFALAVTFVLMIVLISIWRQRPLPAVIVVGLCALALTYLRFANNSFPAIYPWLMLAFFLVALALLGLVKVLKGKAVELLLLLMIGGLAAAYVQMLFLNSSMTMITGDLAAYNAPTATNVINLLVWAGIALAPTVTWIIVRRITRGQHKLDKALIIGAILIAGMQLVGFIATATTATLPIGYNTDAYAFSTIPLSTFNADDNIVVFVVDRLDTAYMDRALLDYPELVGMLDGFTFYRRNQSWYQHTVHNMVTLMTQKPYPNDGIDRGNALSDTAFLHTFWAEAWGRHTVLDTLKDQGFTNNVILDKMSTFGTFDQIAPRVDNLVSITDSMKPHTKAIISFGSQLSFGRLAPYLLKNATLARVSPSFGDDLYLVDRQGGTIAYATAARANDIQFFDYLRRTPFDTKSDRPVLNLVHLNGSHVDVDIANSILGYSLDPETGSIVYGGNWLESTRACFEIMDTYFAGMKDIGVYDESTILILADHGAGTTDAALLIKPKGARGPLLIDDRAPLSHDHFAGTILELAGIGRGSRTPSYFDIIEQSVSR